MDTEANRREAEAALADFGERGWADDFEYSNKLRVSGPAGRFIVAFLMDFETNHHGALGRALAHPAFREFLRDHPKRIVDVDVVEGGRFEWRLAESAVGSSAQPGIVIDPVIGPKARL